MLFEYHELRIHANFYLSILQYWEFFAFIELQY